MAQASNAKRVVVVEDEAGVRRFIWEALSKAGYEVMQTGSGEEMQWLLDDLKRPVDLLVADVMMPGMSGPEFARWLEEVRPTTRVLFVTGQSRESAEKFGLPLGGVEVLYKPFTADGLLKRVADILGP